jgi:hypothetical protein
MQNSTSQQKHSNLQPHRGWFRNTFKRRPLLHASSPASKLHLNGMCVIEHCLTAWVHPTAAAPSIVSHVSSAGIVRCCKRVNFSPWPFDCGAWSRCAVCCQRMGLQQSGMRWQFRPGIGGEISAHTAHSVMHGTRERDRTTGLSPVLLFVVYQTFANFFSLFSHNVVLSNRMQVNNRR